MLLLYWHVRRMCWIEVLLSERSELIKFNEVILPLLSPVRLTAAHRVLLHLIIGLYGVGRRL